MAEILFFQARPRKDRNSDPVPADGAQILFFTGVRYVRMDQAVDSPAVARRKGKSPASRRGPRKRA